MYETENNTGRYVSKHSQKHQTLAYWFSKGPFSVFVSCYYINHKSFLMMTKKKLRKALQNKSGIQKVWPTQLYYYHTHSRVLLSATTTFFFFFGQEMANMPLNNLKAILAFTFESLWLCWKKSSRAQSQKYTRDQSMMQKKIQVTAYSTQSHMPSMAADAILLPCHTIIFNTIYQPG